MHRWAIACALAGCGRVDFDPLGGDCTPVQRLAAPYATDREPYLLCTADQLAAIGDHPEHWASAFRIGAPIDLEGVALAPIGTDATPFTGALDGGGFAIDHLTIDRPGDAIVGWFTRVATPARFDRVVITHATVHGTSSGGILVGYADGVEVANLALDGRIDGGDVGGLLGGGTCAATDGCTALTFRDVVLDVDVAGTGQTGGLASSLFASGAPPRIERAVVSGIVRGAQAVGGFVGDSENTVYVDVTSHARIEAVGEAGGIAGLTIDEVATITGAVATGDVVCTSDACGGLVGVAEGDIVASHASGAVTCDGYCGGLVAGTSGSILRSSATGAVHGGDQTGGLVGDAYGPEISDSFASGSVEGDAQVGGLVGVLETSTATLARVYASGEVRGANQVGGLVGSLGTAATDTILVADSFAAGSVSGTSAAADVGHVAGRSLGLVTRNDVYWATDAACTNTGPACPTPVETPATSAQLQMATQPPLVSWDFATIWREVAGAFPTLR